MTEHGEAGHNMKAVMDKIKSARDQIAKLKSQRQEINADMKAIREGLEAEGIPKKSFDAAMRYFEMDPEQRDAYMNGFLIALEGVGLPVNIDQPELQFPETEEKEETNADESIADTDTEAAA